MMYLFAIIILCLNISDIFSLNVTLSGRRSHIFGLGSIPLSFERMYKGLFNIHSYFDGKYINKSNAEPDDIFIHCDALAYKDWYPLTNMPEAKLKIAYSMFETTKIPKMWVDILNSKFDMVAVPDIFLVNVYQNSGVKIPVFVLPLACDLGDFLIKKPKKFDKKFPFVFGMVSAFKEYKNHALLLKAFKKIFNNNPKVKLIIHGNAAKQDFLNNLKSMAKGSNNIVVDHSNLNAEEYVKFYQKLDAYVLLSQGEGCSITPRQASAVGVPCILSNNTAHKTICQQPWVCSVKSNKLVDANPFFKDYFNAENVGSFADCEEKDVIKALKTLYKKHRNYSKHINKSKLWASQQGFDYLKPFYVTMCQPKKILLGNVNKIENGVLTTNSVNLYDKYISLQK